MRFVTRIAAFCSAALSIAMPSHCQERTQARSMVISKHGIAATSQTLASEAAAQVLERDGLAMDAAIVANAMSGLVEPMSCGHGGDLNRHHQPDARLRGRRPGARARLIGH